MWNFAVFSLIPRGCSDVSVAVSGHQELEHLKFPDGQGSIRLYRPAGRDGRSRGSEAEMSAPHPGMTSIRSCPMSAFTRRSKPMMLRVSMAKELPLSRTLISRLSPSQSHWIRIRLTSVWSTLASTRAAEGASCRVSDFTRDGPAVQRRGDELDLDAAEAQERSQVLL